MSDLRDRIANAIRGAAYQHSYVPGPYLAGIYADAVIAELGLTRGTRSERVPKHRYVTEWTANE